MTRLVASQGAVDTTAPPDPVLTKGVRQTRPRDLREDWSKIMAEVRALWYLRQADSVGRRTRVWGRPAFSVKGHMTLGKGVQMLSTVAKLEIVVEEGAILEIGDDVLINYGASIAATREVRIGAGSLVGMHAMLMDNDYHRLEPERRHERPESAPIILQENVWLGARVIVLRGVTIGANSVVGAGSVVTRDIPPNVIAAGVPAVVLKSI